MRPRALRRRPRLPAGGRRHRGGVEPVLRRFPARSLLLGQPGRTERGAAGPALHLHDPVRAGGVAGDLGCASRLRRGSQFRRSGRGLRVRCAFPRGRDAPGLSPCHAAAAGGRFRAHAGDRTGPPRGGGTAGGTRRFVPCRQPRTRAGRDRMRELAGQYGHLRKGVGADARDGGARPPRPPEPADSGKHRLPFDCDGPVARRCARSPGLPGRVRFRRRCPHGVFGHRHGRGQAEQRILVVQHPRAGPLRGGDGHGEARDPAARVPRDRATQRPSAADPAVPGGGRVVRGERSLSHEGRGRVPGVPANPGSPLPGRRRARFRIPVSPPRAHRPSPARPSDGGDDGQRRPERRRDVRQSRRVFARTAGRPPGPLRSHPIRGPAFRARFPLVDRPPGSQGAHHPGGRLYRAAVAGVLRHSHQHRGDRVHPAHPRRQDAGATPDRPVPGPQRSGPVHIHHLVQVLRGRRRGHAALPGDGSAGWRPITR